MSTPRAHHYLPQFYLRGFSRDDRLWVYDRYKNEYRNQTPKNIAVERDYYTIIDDNGKKKADIEKFFSVIEGKASPVIQKVDARNNISTEERDILSIFMSFLKVRVPDFEKANDEYNEKIIKWMNKFMFCDEKHTKVMLDNYEKDTGEKLDIEPDELMRFIHEDEYRIKVNKNFTLGLMLELGMETAHYLRQMDWIFIYPPKEASFVTTDNPFTLIPPPEYNKFWGVGILSKGAVKYCPLSQHVAVLIKDKGEKIEGGNARRDIVKKLNYRIASNSDRLVIARDEPLLRKIVKITKVDRWVKESRVSVG